MWISQRWKLTTTGLLLAAGVSVWHLAALANKPDEKGPAVATDAPSNRVPPVQLTDKQPISTANAANPTIDAVPALPPVAPAEDSLPDSRSRLTPEAIDEILRLRRAIAGSPVPHGTTSGAAGFASEEQFRNALQQMAGPGTRAAQPVESLSLPAARTPEEARIPVFTNDLPTPHDSESMTSPEIQADFDIVMSLRGTSRLLDNRAHDLDAERLFDESAKLRRLATRLRRDARRIESSALARTASFLE